MTMFKGKAGFLAGFASATVLCGAVAIFAAGEIYSTSPDGDWIRDAGVYNPTSADQINVLGDIQPGAGELMVLAGLKLNALNAAGKKKNWDFAQHEVDEIEETFDKLMITRPGLETDLQTFIDDHLSKVTTAITAQDKTAFQTALEDVTSACTACHVAVGSPFLVVKLGKSAIPIE